MTELSIGEIKCKINFDDFLYLKFNGDKKYKSSYNTFPELYEFIDRNINKITYMKFDNYEYFLENGFLHNLYGPAHIKYSTTQTAFSNIGQKIFHYYIDGKIVHDKLDDRGCRKKVDFKGEIFFYEELTNNKSGRDSSGKLYRRKENIDYRKTIINLNERIKIDQRNKKLKKLISLKKKNHY